MIAKIIVSRNTGLKILEVSNPDDKRAIISPLSSILLNTRVHARKNDNGISTSNETIFLKKMIGTKTVLEIIPVAAF